VGKFFFLLVLAVIAVLFFKTAKSRPRGAQPKTADAPERMVQCARCQAFMPESDSITTDGKVSCRDPGQCPHRQ